MANSKLRNWHMGYSQDQVIKTRNAFDNYLQKRFTENDWKPIADTVISSDERDLIEKIKNER